MLQSPEEAACELFANITGVDVVWRYWHCPAQSHFLVTSNTTRHAVFTLRLVGPSLVFTSQSRKLDGGRGHQLQYRTNAAGSYQAYIYTLFDYAVENITTNCVSSTPAKNLTFTVTSDQVSPFNIGLWEWAEPQTGNLSVYQQQIVSHPFQPGSDEPFANLSYKYPFLPEDYLRSCMSAKITCLVGDSHMRHNFQHITQLLYGDRANCTKRDTACSIAGSSVHFITLHFSHEWPAAAARVANHRCDTVVINFGQWPLSFQSPALVSYTSYRGQLEALFATLSALTADVFWMDTNPLPQHPYTRTCPPKDFRFPHVIAYYNEIASMSLRMYPRLKLIPSFDMVFQLWDVTYDGAHYSGPVGMALAKLMASAICKPI
jgi:hypothetical protein